MNEGWTSSLCSRSFQSGGPGGGGGGGTSGNGVSPRLPEPGKGGIPPDVGGNGGKSSDSEGGSGGEPSDPKGGKGLRGSSDGGNGPSDGAFSNDGPNLGKGGSVPSSPPKVPSLSTSDGLESGRSGMPGRLPMSGSDSPRPGAESDIRGRSGRGGGSCTLIG